tara:strand:+ start:2108 stop:2269 length:162 start_codon:yes stop_codon:yes gene_type:complete
MDNKIIQITELVSTTPNDMDLGKVARSFIREEIAQQFPNDLDLGQIIRKAWKS